MAFGKTIGTRAEVMHGVAEMTSGGLKKKSLKYNPRGEIVSLKKSNKAKKSSPLVKQGYTKLAKKASKQAGGFVPMQKM